MAGQALRAAQKRKFKSLVFALNDGDLVRSLTEGCVYGGYEPPKYKSDEVASTVEELSLIHI